MEFGPGVLDAKSASWSGLALGSAPVPGPDLPAEVCLVGDALPKAFAGKILNSISAIPSTSSGQDSINCHAWVCGETPASWRCAGSTPPSMSTQWNSETEANHIQLDQDSAVRISVTLPGEATGPAKVVGV